KSLGVDALVTLTARPEGVSLTSHGPSSVSALVPCAGTEGVGVDGLGSVVVLGRALQAAVNSKSGGPIDIDVEPRSPGRAVRVEGSPVWTVDAKPLGSADASEPEYVHGLTAAIVRALAFASRDDPRPNIHCVALRGEGDHAL